MKSLFQVLLFWIVAVKEGLLLSQTYDEAILSTLSNQTNLIVQDDTRKILSRKKRFLVFPLGSSFSVAACMTVGVYGNPNYNMFSWAVNWGIAYNLPNETISIQRDMMEPKPMAQRRHRRDLYQKMEMAINRMGYNGRECVLRALCESSQFFGKKGSNMAAEMLRSLFSFPKTRVLSMEPDDIRIYDEAHRKGKSQVRCESMYPVCRFSLLEVALGKYASPLRFM